MLPARASGHGWPAPSPLGKINRHPSDADFPPHQYLRPARRRHAFTTMSSLLYPTTLCFCRLIICIGMSFFGGLTNRFAYAPSRWVIVRDVVAAALENNLILLGMESTVATSQLPVRHKSKPHKHMRGRHSYHLGYGMMRATRLIVHRSLVGALCVAWVIASWGDYVFESESRGLIPTMWVIAPGLKDPAVHAGVQMRNHKDVFVGGLIRCLVGLCIGLGYAWIVHSFCSSASTTKRTSPYFKDRQKNANHFSVNNLRDLFNALKIPRLLGCNIVALLTLFLFGAWAPLTNLTYCILGIFLLTPPGGGKSEVTLPTIRGSSFNIRSKKQQRRSTPPPNVIVFVHESLSGAAMQSARGIDAAPFFHSMRSNPNFYDFRFARTTAGTTPIATPSLLTGLMPFDDDGVELVKRASLASDFKRLGYDTSCFAAYGADWTGNAWEILSYMLMPGFDAIFDPKATGDALVNEYGMDDRVLSNHFVQWLKTRRAPGNVTTSGTNDDSDEMSSNATSSVVPDSKRENRKRTRDQTEQNQRRKQKQKPFFSLIVQNNNHFPHLMHETYSGDPDCEREKDDMGSNSNMTTVEPEGENSNPDLGLDSYEEDFGWDEDYGGGTSCGFSDVSRYFSSIRTIDEALKTIFDALDASGELNNTVIMGAGDHGEVPGVLERMSDVNAPLLSIPLWMYIPEHLLPDRAYMKKEKTRQKRRRSTDDTYLRANVGNGVSILDVVPTLRDLIGFDEIYSSSEISKCVVGQSLLSQQSSNKRIMMSWQGLPLQGHQIGIFSTASETLLYYRKHPSLTKQVDYLFAPDDVFFSRSEHPLNEEPVMGKKWELRLQEEGLLDHPAVKKWMPNLKDILDKPMAKTMDENVENDEQNDE